MHVHDHHGHGHSGNQRRVFWAALLTTVFMVAEAVGGILSGSLALLADAGHMLLDAAALILAWFAFRLSVKGHDTRRTYGYHRFQILAAFVNGLTLIVIAVWIVTEAAERVANPVPVLGEPMLVIALLGLLVNAVVFLILHGADANNLNIRGATLHVLGDMLGSGAAVAAATVILLTGWMPIDPILSVLVAVLVLRAAWSVVRMSGHVLLEGVPEDVDLDEIRQTVAGSSADIFDVHHVHAWLLTSERPMLTLHAKIRDGADLDETLACAHAALHERFGIAHATIQLEVGACPDAEHDDGEAASAT